jgi:hypothetical protein
MPKIIILNRKSERRIGTIGADSRYGQECVMHIVAFDCVGHAANVNFDSTCWRLSLHI